MKTAFDESWKNWIKTNVDNGQEKDGIFKILLDEGYDYHAICREMNYKPSVPLDQLRNPFTDAKRLLARCDEDNGALINTNQLFLPNAKRVESDRLELYTLEDFLDEDECAQFVQLIRSSLKPSGLSSYEKDSSYRTSRTCDLAQLQNPFVKEVDDRICKIMGIHSSYSEAIQGQYYEVGEEFKAHTDYFEAHELQEHGAEMGQRTFTVMIYLNDTKKGGHTKFVNIDSQFEPKTGTAVIWNTLNADGSINFDSIHHGMPVEEGYKAVITKWFRSTSSSNQEQPMFIKERNEFVPNYTKIGFKKTKIPSDLFAKILKFYRENGNLTEDEIIPGDFFYTKEKGKQSSVLIDLSPELRTEIHETMQPLLEKWCGQRLDPTFVYGIRVYKDKAILTPHRDRVDTHIISAIINVGQEVREDWPLILDDNYYRSHRVVMEPGDVLFYEGARLAHGRPIALNGKSFANIFCHFKLADYMATGSV